MQPLSIHQRINVKTAMINAVMIGKAQIVKDVSLSKHHKGIRNVLACKYICLLGHGIGECTQHLFKNKTH